MTVLQTFMRDRKLKDGVSNAMVNRALQSSVALLKARKD
jgi:hypothetical protein